MPIESPIENLSKQLEEADNDGFKGLEKAVREVGARPEKALHGKK